MDPHGSILGPIIIVFALVFANGFFVAAEFALVRSRETKVRSAEFRRKFGSGLALRLFADIDGNLSAIQLGITIASLLLGWYGEETLHVLFLDTFQFFGPQYADILSHALATALAFSVITYLHIVLGEVCAKSIGIRFPETTLRLVSGPLLAFTTICRPLIIVLNASANLFLRLVGVGMPSPHDQAHSMAELAMLVAQSGAGGFLDKDEEEMLQGVIELSRTVAREIMTPRTDIIAVPVDSNLEEVMEIFAKSGFSRLPVIGETVDNLLGILVIKDVLPYVADRISGRKSEFNVRGSMRECYFIPGTKPIDDLLSEFKKRKLHIAIVLDEHGGVDGVVTLEDLIEEIVGDIFDESDIPERDIIVRENGEILVSGGVLVDDFNSRFPAAIPEGSYDTMGGFVLTHLGRAPKVGDEIRLTSRGVWVNGELNRELLTVENGNGREDESSSHTRLIVIMAVKKVTGHRIRTLQIRTELDSNANLESDTTLAASENEGRPSSTSET